MVRSSKGGALRDRYIHLTRERGKGKKKTIVAIGRRMAELMYSILRSKTDYEVRPWKKPQKNIGVPKASFTIANISFRLQNTLRVFLLPLPHEDLQFLRAKIFISVVVRPPTRDRYTGCLYN